MKISYNWLKDYLNLEMDPHELAEALSLVGLEVEEVIENRLDFEHVVVGKVVEKDKHPNADKLSLCKVDAGDETISIVCGAPNVAAGQLVPVAKVGAVLPGGFKIKKSKIRGEQSFGMICSEAELGISEKADGIWVLDENTTPGQPLHQALNYETDFVFDVALTPNRPDCLSHIGVAREVGAIIGQKIQKKDAAVTETDNQASEKISVTINNPETCPRYSARYIDNITVGESPEWLVRRLESVGMRSINNVVDITNYVLLETGHPLHAFDYKFIKNGDIVVRESEAGETFVTLDEQERKLKAGTVLICDAEKPVAIGGIMGGMNSEVSAETNEILLESAYFKPESIQISSRYLGLSTEASQRFERGADPNGTEYAMERASSLLAELCGGRVYKGIVDVYPNPIKEKAVPLKVEQINNLLGTELDESGMAEILDKIDLPVQDHNVIAPTYRPDLERVADLAEEILRLYGLTNVPSAKLTRMPYQLRMNDFDFFIDQLKSVLTGMGLQEVMTGSMVSKDLWKKFSTAELYPILNPISKDMDVMRNSLVPSLAQVIQHNRNRQIKDLKIFEINRIFEMPEDIKKQPLESHKICFALTGARDGNSWNSSKSAVDFYDIKGLVLEFISKISLDCPDLIYYSENVNVDVVYKKKTVGNFGALADNIARAFDLEDPVFVAELDLLELFNLYNRDHKYEHIPKFPWVDRDLAFVVDETVEAKSLIDLILKNGGKYLKNIEVFDVFRGKQIEAGKKSIAFRLIFQTPERTLSDEDVAPALEKIIAVVTKKVEAKLRD